jgi:L-gulono-1,4-lactone dehydrogenase
MNKSWSNWLGNHRARPNDVASPASVEDVVQAVETAKARHQRIRVLGAGFAWSPLVPLDGLLISTKKLSAVRHIDHRRCQITVETGMLLSELVEIAARNGMSVKSTSMFLGLSVGGLIATGSHGTGRNAATFGDAVVGFELVKADGSVLKVDAPGSELWRAVITNLGTLGVLTAVTLQCEPLYNVHEIHIRVHIAETAAMLPRMLNDYEFVSLFWYPSSGSALFKVGNRSPLPAVPMERRRNPSRPDRFLGLFGRFLPGIASSAPFLKDVVGDTLNAGVGTGTQVVSEPDFSHYKQVYPRVISSEFAIPLELAPDAWTWLYLRLMEYWKAGVRPVNLVAHARFGSASRAFLASSSGRASCYLEVLCFKGNRQRDLFQSEFHQKMESAFCGRPHWGKEIFNPWHAARGYGENLDRFLEYRHDLDPEQRFLNPFLRDEVFGLGRRLARGTTDLSIHLVDDPASDEVQPADASPVLRASSRR